VVVVQWPREDLAADAVADHEVNLWRMALGRRPILLRDLAAGGVVILGFGFHRFLGFLEFLEFFWGGACRNMLP